MSLDNFHDLSVIGSNTNAGFQFEFYCSHCTQRWKSPFKPYRAGQLGGLLSQLTYFFNGTRDASHHVGRVSDWRSRGARESALEEAQEMAQRLYSVCSGCGKAACENCFDNGEQLCTACMNSHADAAYGSGGNNHAGHHAAAGGQAAARGPSCPNCGTGNLGGRFCAECGFDMASTHKSCPSCGAMSERGARFCGDCGHGF